MIKNNKKNETKHNNTNNISNINNNNKILITINIRILITRISRSHDDHHQNGSGIWDPET